MRSPRRRVAAAGPSGAIRLPAFPPQPLRLTRHSHRAQPAPPPSGQSSWSPAARLAEHREAAAGRASKAASKAASTQAALLGASPVPPDPAARPPRRDRMPPLPPADCPADGGGGDWAPPPPQCNEGRWTYTMGEEPAWPIGADGGAGRPPPPPPGRAAGIIDSDGGGDGGDVGGAHQTQQPALVLRVRLGRCGGGGDDAAPAVQSLPGCVRVLFAGRLLVVHWPEPADHLRAAAARSPATGELVVAAPPLVRRRRRVRPAAAAAPAGGCGGKGAGPPAAVLQPAGLGDDDDPPPLPA